MNGSVLLEDSPFRNSASKDLCATTVRDCETMVREAVCGAVPREL